ncbi:acyltransferase family protein [Mycobacterium bohemicum]|uniref:acyltransferase family protein n=1 Tax=Mycobacterium bohemicum TaxID=56425 RepID=UPI00111C474E|nr:acyltransferase family protein [Mycobacterium bohemicum]MCV6968592.1 acyltransferase family protein [Mycobacterium bohemicum]
MYPAPARSASRARWVAPVRRAGRLAIWDQPERRSGIPALDGLRAIAVTLVLVGHGGIPGVSGGFIGVDVFFVLSGFLITSLLLDELRRTGRIELTGFWIRRARRLLPALMLMVLTVAAARGLLPDQALTGLRDDAIAAFLWVANWRFVAQKTDYFTQGAPPSPLQHTWSLGVEEQYYFVWPVLLIAVTLLLAARARRRHGRATVGGVRFAIFVVASLGALASAALTVVVASHGTRDRVYFGTDTRAQALLVGAAAAALLVRDWPSLNRGWCLIGTRWGRRVARVLPMTGLAGLAAATHYATGAAGEFRHGLLSGVAIAAVLVIAPVALEQRGAVARALAWRPLVWLGTISYGVYLWHWPIFLALNGERTGWAGLPLFAARCAATVAAAGASWWLIEQPIRRWRPARVPLLPLAAATVASAAAITLLVVPVGTGPGLREPGLPPGVSAVAAVSPSPPGGSRPAPRDPNRPFTVSVFGDSIGWTWMHYLPPTPGFAFLDHTVIGCSLVRGTPYRYIGQTLEQRSECDGWPIRWAAQVAQDQPDVALLIIGRWETVDRVNEGQWTHIGDPTFDAYLNGELERALNIVGSTGVRVVVATVPYSRGGEKPDGRLYPEDQPERVNLWNTMLRKTAAHHPNVQLLDLNKKLCPDGVYTAKVDGIKVRSDGVHLTPEGVKWLTPWLEESLR